MRLLRFSPPPPDYTAALAFLRKLPAAFPAGTTTAQQAAALRFIVAVAAQHRGRNGSWQELLEAGHSALVACYRHYAAQPRNIERNWAFWVREGVFKKQE